MHFHKLDLSSIESSRSSAHSLKKKISQISADGDLGRLDIVVCNAAIAFSPQSILSPDGYERTFAVNCLGHFVFVTSLMGMRFLIRPSLLSGTRISHRIRPRANI